MYISISFVLALLVTANSVIQLMYLPAIVSVSLNALLSHSLYRHVVDPNKISRLCSQLNSRVRFFGGLGGGSDLHRDFHSTPDLNVQVQSSILAPKGHRSQEDVNALNGRNGLPPPNHPPPPPPVGQVVKVNVGANVPDVVTPASVYDNMAHIQQVKGISMYTRISWPFLFI